MGFLQKSGADGRLEHPSRRNLNFGTVLPLIGGNFSIYAGISSILFRHKNMNNG